MRLAPPASAIVLRVGPEPDRGRSVAQVADHLGGVGGAQVRKRRHACEAGSPCSSSVVRSSSVRDGTRVVIAGPSSPPLPSLPWQPACSELTNTCASRVRSLRRSGRLREQQEEQQDRVSTRGKCITVAFPSDEPLHEPGRASQRTGLSGVIVVAAPARPHSFQASRGSEAPAGARLA